MDLFLILPTVLSAASLLSTYPKSTVCPHGTAQSRTSSPEASMLSEAEDQGRAKAGLPTIMQHLTCSF